MKSKKYLALIFSGQSLNELFSKDSFMLGKLCESFEKIYIINVHELRFFSDHLSFLSCLCNFCIFSTTP